MTCADCGQGYPFTPAEQAFYAERHLRLPVRCPACRSARRMERNGEMIRAFQDTGRMLQWDGGFGNYGGAAAADANARLKRGGSNGYPAVCADCGKETLIPFPPRRGRPVYCRDCFAARKRR